MRKSLPTNKTIKGNATKYDSYREAWSRIQLAQEQSFFLEAITIQESILSDRLIRFLSLPTLKRPLKKKKSGQWPPFGELIRLWRLNCPEPLSCKSYPDLIKAVDQWRKMRNEAVHAIVKSEPGEPTAPIESFLDKARFAAEEGTRLAREVSNWIQREKRKKPS